MNEIVNGVKCEVLQETQLKKLLRVINPRPYFSEFFIVTTYVSNPKKTVQGFENLFDAKKKF